jgi:hypothetical protein
MNTETCFPNDFFTYWSNLAKTDPERFERERKEAIEAVILQAPLEKQQRLRGLQWRIDMERSRANNPLSACIRLNKMMMDFAFSDKGLPRMASLFREVSATLVRLEKDLSLTAK